VSNATPFVTAPEVFDRRSAAAPALRIELHEPSYFAVEVASRPELFDRELHGAERSPDTFYASW
jgi:hypothetical protein